MAISSIHFLSKSRQAALEERTLTVPEEVEVPFAAHPCRTQEVFDDEHGKFLIRGDHERSFYSGFGVDEMVTVLPVEGEAVPFEDSGERPVVDGSERGHLLYAHCQSIK